MEAGATMANWLASPLFYAALLAFLIAWGLSFGVWRKVRVQARELERQKILLADAMSSASETVEKVKSAAAAVDFHPQADAVPEALVEACARGSCVLFTGGGVSALGGLPTWHEVLLNVTERWKGEFSEERREGIEALLAQGEYDAVAELLESRLGRIGLMLDVGLELSGGQPPEALTNLVSHVPFPAFLTTNYDDFLERALAHRAPLALTPRSGHDFSTLLRETQPFVLKLHGDLDAPESATTTMSELRATVDEMPALKASLRAFFETRSVFFIGQSPQSIEKLCDAIGMWRSTQRHFALVPDGPQFDLGAERFSTRYQIELLRASSGSEVSRFLHDLAHLVEERIVELESEWGPKSLEPARITRLALQNIGPFKQAEFEFTKPWTVILGNNGTGKSTVLRALALALAGTDSEAAKAGRSLIRRGELSASIELTVVADAVEATYQTRLAVHEDGVVIQASTAPLQAGTLVAFGFPAIRGIPPASGFDPTGEVPYSYPRVADVVPLIRGGADERATNLRRWIFNSYVRSQDERLPAAARTRYRRAIDAFFTLVDAMAPGFDLAFSRCDTETFEILLKTSDGEIPLDYISQGMSSTIGWAGIVMQRLAEIYADQDDPQACQALLLIDEVDSHLHPEWQMNLVPSLKQLLPNVQIVATTHSPLMVGNLGKNEVIRVRRNGIELAVEHLAQSFTGYRADQILTDAPFEMDSTRARSWEALRDEYADLSGLTQRTSEEEERFAWLTETLRQAPPPFESREERVQAEELEAALRTAIEAVAGDEELLRKLKAQVHTDPSESA
jgi:predicted ATPase